MPDPATNSQIPKGSNLARGGIKSGAVRRLRRPVENATTGRDEGYSEEETDFLLACEAYRTRYAKRFLAACDYLFVLKSMGYSR